MLKIRRVTSGEDGGPRRRMPCSFARSDRLVQKRTIFVLVLVVLHLYLVTSRVITYEIYLSRGSGSLNSNTTEAQNYGCIVLSPG